MRNQRGDMGAGMLVVMLVMMVGAWLLWGHGGHRGMGPGHHAEAPAAPAGEAVEGGEAAKGGEAAEGAGAPVPAPDLAGVAAPD